MVCPPLDQLRVVSDDLSESWESMKELLYEIEVGVGQSCVLQL